jgi:hypothetical protein
VSLTPDHWQGVFSDYASSSLADLLRHSAPHLLPGSEEMPRDDGPGLAPTVPHGTTVLALVHGDVMNTTARLEQMARELDRRLVISADAMSRLEGADQFASEDLGDCVLRGRTSPVRIFSVLGRVPSG